MPIIFRKTARGSAEIETRANRLPPRARALLILVDGKRDEAALGALAPMAEDTLALLRDGGYIESAGNAPPAATPPPSATDTGPRSRRMGLPTFESRRMTLARALNDALGPAAETLAIRIERAPDERELALLQQQAVQWVGRVRGRSAAEALAVRFDTVASVG